MSAPGSTLMRGLLEVFILHSLAEEPKHGYALLKEMEESFGEEPNRNKIYPLLSRLEERGLIEGSADEGSARGRTVYSLTEKGARTLDAYRAMPPTYRDTIARIWEREAAGARRTGAEKSAPDGGGGGGGGDDSVPPYAADLPYPCADARVHAQKDPVTGELALRLTGCPMGKYDYCPVCPMSKAVAGFRRLMFG